MEHSDEEKNEDGDRDRDQRGRRRSTVIDFADQASRSTVIDFAIKLRRSIELCNQRPATFPLDLVRRRMQLEGAGGRARVYNTGLFGTFGYIIRTEGFRGLYRGILPEYYKVVPTVGIVFMTYEKLKQILSDVPANN